MTRPAGLGGRRMLGLSLLALLVAVLLAYLPGAWNGFVDYDDGDYVTANSRVQSGLTWGNVVWAFTSGDASNWHPLTWLSHMADWQCFGAWAGGHHLASLGLHLLNVWLLFLVLRRATGAAWPSLVVAGLFGLHPLHVESVAWVSERKDVLSALFFILTLYAYVRFAEARPAKAPAEALPPAPSVASQTEPARHPAGWYCLSLVLFALGLMSKPMLVTLPFLLLLMDFWPLKRTAAGQGSERLFDWKQAGWLLVEKTPFFLLSAASSVVTFLVQQHGGSVSSSLTIGERFANALVSYARYLAKTFWPVKLSVLYPHPGQWATWRVIVTAVLLVAIIAVVLRVARKRPYALVGWLWFVGTLVPVIGLVQVGVQSMADRYTYIPLIGLFVALTWWVADAVKARPGFLKAAAGGAAVVLAVCGWLTFNQVHFWRNTETLFTNAVRVTDQNYLAYNNLGFYLSKQGRVDEAMENYEKSLRIKPNYEDALNNMGHALAGRGRQAEAVPYYQAALRVRPNHADVLNNYGNTLADLGKVDEAIECYRAALKQKPNHTDAHNNLAVALAMQGKFDEAVREFGEVLRLRPGYASAHSNLGNVYAVQGKLDDAIREYSESLRLKPDEAQAHNNLGNVLAQKGRADEAIAHYVEAIRLNANNPEAHYNLGRALQSRGKIEEAAGHFQEALRLKPSYVEARKQLEALQVAPGNPKP